MYKTKRRVMNGLEQILNTVDMTNENDCVVRPFINQRPEHAPKTDKPRQWLLNVKLMLSACDL